MGASGRPPLRRSPDGLLGGVAAGIAEHLGIAPLLVRLGFVALVFAGGSGLLLYLIMWLVVPARDTVGSPQGQARDVRSVTDQLRTSPWWKWGLVGLGGLLLILALTDASPGPVIWAVALIAAGVLLMTREDRSVPADASPPADPAPPATQAVVASPAPTAAFPVPSPSPPPGFGPAPDVSPEPSPPPKRPQKPASVLGQLTLAVALLAAGGGAVLDNLGLVDLGARHYLALATLAIGLGLLVGAWAGRARWLGLVACLLLPALLLAGVSEQLSTSGEIGDRRYAPTTVEEVLPSYSLLAGAVELDLTGLDPDDLAQLPPIDIEVTVGETVVLVPPDADVDASGAVRVGALDLLDRTFEGVNVRGTVLDTVEDPVAELTIVVEQTFGEITVSRAPRAEELEDP